MKFVEANHHSVEVDKVQLLLKEWGQNNFRGFPWRHTSNPYHTLIAEVMLHRTQAIQVVPVYEQFIQQYPNIQNLAGATKEELQTLLFPLGLRWRIDLIHSMAWAIMQRFNGLIPESKNDLLSLPGVSEYIAGAVRCFAWNYPEAIADTNTIRVVGRIFGLMIKDSSRRNTLFKSILTQLVDSESPRQYNYALLDLADKICTKKQEPDCSHCPLQTMCCYGRNQLESGN